MSIIIVLLFLSLHKSVKIELLFQIIYISYYSYKHMSCLAITTTVM